MLQSQGFHTYVCLPSEARKEWSLKWKKLKEEIEKVVDGICKRGNDVYEGTFTLYRQNGTQFNKSFSRTTEKEIIDIQAQLRILGILGNDVKTVNIDRNTNKITLVKKGQSKESIGLDKDMLVKDYLTFFLYNHRKKGVKGRIIEDTTFAVYKDRADIVTKYIGDKKMRELTFDDVEDFINEINKTMADTTVVQVRQMITSMFYYAKKDNVVDENILVEEKINIKEKKGRKEKRILQEKELPIFINYCKEHKYYILLFILRHRV